MGNAPISIYCPYCHGYTSLTVAPGYPSGKGILALWQKKTRQKNGG